MLRVRVLGAMFLIVNVLSAQYKETYVAQYLDIAISEMHRSGIPASIKLSQAILESNYGRSELAREAHNHFGIKCGREWGGKGYHLKDDDRDGRGELVHSCFRVFTSAQESYIAHSDFLMDPGKAHRYGALFNLAPDDYKGWAEGLKRGGYATNPEYARLLIRIIEEQQLYKYDVARIDDAIASANSRTHAHPRKPDHNVSRNGRDAYTIQFQNDIPFILAAPGDNAKTIAKQTDVAARKILKYNAFADNRRSQFQEGDRIYLQPLKRKYHGNQTIHVVQPGETLAMIAHAYAIKADALRKRNNLADDCEPATGSRLVLRGNQKHTIRCASEATFVSVPAQKHSGSGTASAALVATETRVAEPRTESESKEEIPVLHAMAPGLSDDFVREITSYTVQPKDTLYQIATRHGITVAELKKLNNLTSDTIRPGQSLKVQR